MQTNPIIVIRRLEEKYRKYDMSFEDLARYVVYLEPEVDIDYYEAIRDYSMWLEALKKLKTSNNSTGKTIAVEYLR